MSGVTQILTIVNELLKAGAIEKASTDVSIHNLKNETEKMKGWRTKLSDAMAKLPAEQQKAAVKHILILAAGMTNHTELLLVFGLIEILVANNVLPARMVCESILSCDKLVYGLPDFRVGCFTLIRKITDSVEYKRVGKIMKDCVEKAQAIPAKINSSVGSRVLSKI